MWPMWLRILAVPFRLLAVIVLCLPCICVMLVDEDLGCFYLSFILEVGNKPLTHIGN